MSTVNEVRVPNIGDFKEVEVIELMVKPGDRVQPEQSLITVESDKATMEIPAPGSGIVREVKVKVGDKVSEGSIVLTMDSEASLVATSGPATEPPRTVLGKSPEAAVPAVIVAPASAPPTVAALQGTCQPFSAPVRP
jgi:pyruvate/2-oxoglutarate dehydrogenase complex dihydrolipoamide acyltransferase (E2) component